MSAQKFKEAINKFGLGDTLDPLTLSNEQSTWIAEQRHLSGVMDAVIRKVFPRLPPVHVDFIDSDSVGAWAFPYMSSYFIGITRGAVEVIVLLFHRMFSDQRILTVIGNPNNENEYNTTGKNLTAALLQDAAAYGTPRISDPIRQAYCWWVIDAAVMFLFAHEIHHILNGHVDYSDAKNGQPFIAELGFSPSNDEESLEYQLLEADADLCATGTCVDFVGGQANKPTSKIPQLQTYEGLLFAQLFAAFTVFRIFGDEPIDGSALYKNSHPPFRFRVSLVWEAVVSVAQKRHGVSFNQLENILGTAAYELELAFSIITGEELSPPERYTEAFSSPECQQYRRRMINRWNGGLRQSLLSYAYGSPVTWGAEKPSE